MGLPNFRAIYASFRTPEEERRILQRAFLRLTGFVGICVSMALFASKFGRRVLTVLNSELS
ncbi:hypothetical protein SYNPS1DRAFT_23497 [Syncephalis pseudoplumigaleata]|uniref:Uncharacterized protein n=1 Tax=Syncephalis pseudoplumigaleata TaxID=1712513 RepID=A0A4P9YWV8_9FUNG|nr:hypothetical protein SYNPS1DRAFT_23497 [Syncephalis pseudoplumigaleata]|eukprot:RKP24414.1 hypothetical protein SYNPS1DRAFT_23497 [Syncephalis pseudoplumigaleata]